MAMDVVGIDEASVRDEDAWREAMRTPGEVAAMLEIKRRGWGCNGIARVRHLSQDGATLCARARPAAPRQAVSYLIAAAANLLYLLTRVLTEPVWSPCKSASVTLPCLVQA